MDELQPERDKTVFTLVDSLNGNLAFKIFSFDNDCYFDHLQRLNYYSIVLVTEGRGVLKADFSSHDFARNSLMCFSPYQPHMISRGSNLKGISINFHPDFFCIYKHHREVSCQGILFNNIYDPPFFSLTSDEVTKLIDLIEQMKGEMVNVELAQRELLVSYLKVFLITASRIKAGQVSERQTVAEGTEPFILQSLRDAIENNFRSKHAPSDYADLLNISAKALAKISKSHFNKTLTELIFERIIIEAKRELYLTSKPVKEIAYDLGFSDEYYFSRFFKNNVDVSPQLYRHAVGYARGSFHAESGG